MILQLSRRTLVLIPGIHPETVILHARLRCPCQQAAQVPGFDDPWGRFRTVHSQVAAHQALYGRQRHVPKRCVHHEEVRRFQHVRRRQASSHAVVVKSSAAVLSSDRVPPAHACMVWKVEMARETAPTKHRRRGFGSTARVRPLHELRMPVNTGSNQGVEVQRTAGKVQTNITQTHRCLLHALPLTFSLSGQ